MARSKKNKNKNVPKTGATGGGASKAQAPKGATAKPAPTPEPDEDEEVGDEVVAAAEDDAPEVDEEDVAAAAGPDEEDDDDDEEWEEDDDDDDDDDEEWEEDDDDEDEEDEEEEESSHRPPTPARVAASPSQAVVREGMILVKIMRQDAPDEQPYWEEFEVEDEGGMNVISCLMAIQKNPVNINGETTTPVAWDQSCLEEVCGSCTMVINGRVRQSCSALTRNLEQPIVLEPMRKFKVIRDLIVDRSRMFEALKRVKAWVPIDGTYDLGPGPRMPAETALENYTLSTCMTCGCCLDACPQVNDHTDFIGAAAISQARLFNAHPTGAMTAHERIEALMEDGGLHECGNAQNCVQVCPKEIPLTTSIAEMARQTSLHLLKRLTRH